MSILTLHACRILHWSPIPNARCTTIYIFKTIILFGRKRSKIQTLTKRTTVPMNGRLSITQFNLQVFKQQHSNVMMYILDFLPHTQSHSHKYLLYRFSCNNWLKIICVNSTVLWTPDRNYNSSHNSSVRLSITNVSVRVAYFQVSKSIHEGT